MTLADLVKKYAGSSGEVEDWTAVSHDDLYSYLDDNRDGLIALQEKGILRDQIWAKEVIRRCEQDLLWLAGWFTHETNPETAGNPISANMIRPENHGPFQDFFVKKDKAKDLPEQSSFKNRLLLWPRGGLKTTWGMVDIVQWILNFPQIRILILTAAEDLAVKILDETKGHFLVKVYQPSLMNIFFPEFCKEEKDMGNQFEYTCPVWEARNIKRREPTIMASSVTSTLSGFHFEVLHLDDAISNRNAQNEEQCLSINKNFKINKKMLRPWGYCTKIGTRYFDSDMYGIDLENNIGEYTTTSGEGWELTENKTTSSLILIGRAIQIKPEVREELVKKNIPPHLHYQEAGENGCILVMPNVLSYAHLVAMYNEDRTGGQNMDGTFEGQMNQNPVPEEEAVFDMALLLRSTVPFTDLPYRGLISHTWDLAFSKKEYRDFTAGSSVIWNEKGQAFVNDLVRDRFATPTAAAKAIVDLAVKHHPFVIGIEDAAGSKFLEPTIVAEAYKTGDPFVIQVCSRIDWIPVSHQKEAKKARMAALQPLLADGLLRFANYLPYLKTLYEEFMRCQVNQRRHNDIPDVISFQPRYAPRIVKQIMEQGIPSWSKEQAAWNMIFEENTDPFGQPGGGGVMTTSLEEPKISENIEAQSYATGLDSILGGGLIG